MGKALNNIGNIHLQLSQSEGALNYYQQALETDKKIGNVRGEGRILNNIGLIYLKLSEYDKALSFLQQALKIAKKIGDLRGEETTLIDIGIYYAILIIQVVNYRKFDTFRKEVDCHYQIRRRKTPSAVHAWGK